MKLDYTRCVITPHMPPQRTKISNAKLSMIFVSFIMQKTLQFPENYSFSSSRDSVKNHRVETKFELDLYFLIN